MAKKEKTTSDVIENVAGFIEWVDGLEGGLLLYRGLANSDYEVTSSAERRISSARTVLLYIKDLLVRAKRKRLHKIKEELTDLELLAELQHQGAATCLIDFTENSLVALWFACQSDRDQKQTSNGKLIAMRTDNADHFQIVNEDDLEEKIEKFFTERKLWKWTPWQQSNRILAQHSVFVFGNKQINETDYQSVEIAQDAKIEILAELNKKFGINEEYIFSDLIGFATANAHNKTYQPENAEGNFRVALSLYQEGGFKLAMEYADKALHIDPDFQRGYAMRGLAKKKLKDYSGAVADYDQAIKLNPDDVLSYGWRGSAKLKLKDYSGAVADYDETIKREPDDAVLYKQRGLAKLKLKDYLGAVADYDQAIKLSPSDAVLYKRRGLAKLKLKDYSGAVADCDKAIELDSKYVTAYYVRGFAKSDSGDTQGAINDYTKAVELDPEYASAYYNRGIARTDSGDIQGAEQDMVRAYILDPCLRTEDKDDK